MSHKLFFWITDKETSIITEKLAQDKSQDSVVDYILGMLKDSIVAMKIGEINLLKLYDITRQDIESIELDFDEKYVRENAKKKVINLYGETILNGLIFIAKSQYLNNVHEKRMLFSSIDDYFSVLLKEHCEGLEVEFYNKKIDEDYEKSRNLNQTKTDSKS